MGYQLPVGTSSQWTRGGSADAEALSSGRSIGDPWSRERDVTGLAEPSLALTPSKQPAELGDAQLTASQVAQLKPNGGRGGAADLRHRGCR